jgi:hypothetical protein
MPFLTTTGGLNFSYPTDGTTNWGSTLKTSFNTISAHNHTGAPNGVQLGTNSLQNNAITEAKFRLTNDSFLRGRNAADSADINILKVTTGDALQFGNGTSNATISAANITLSGSGTISSSGPFVFPAGTVSAPSVTFTGDLNTGFYQIAADTIGVATNGSERVRVTDVGDLGIGTSSPTNTANITTVHASGTNGSRLLLGRTASTASVRGIYNDGTGLGFYDYTAAANRMLIDSSGNVGIGATPSELLHLKSSAPRIRLEDTDGANTSIYANISGNTAAEGSIFIQADPNNLGTNSNVGIDVDGTTRLSVSSSKITSTVPYVASTGSASAPSLTFTSDENTGLYSIGADTIGFSTGGTERARITSSGQLQVTSTSGNPCDVTSSTNAIVRSISTNGYASFLRNASSGQDCYDFYHCAGVEVARITATSTNSLTFSNGSAATARMTILSTGDVGIGTVSTGGYRVAVVGSAASSKTLYLHTDASRAYVYSPDEIAIGSTGAQALIFVTNNLERARFTSGGGFTCAGVYSTIVGGTNRDVFVDNGGVVGYVSSLRDSKTEIQDLTDISWLYQLNPVSFKYRKRDENGAYTDETDGGIQYGMIAEDVEPIRPDLCFYDEVDGQQELRGIQYSKLTAVLLKAVQDLKAEIETLKAQVTSH